MEGLSSQIRDKREYPKGFIGWDVDVKKYGIKTQSLGIETYASKIIQYHIQYTNRYHHYFVSCSGFGFLT